MVHGYKQIDIGGCGKVEGGIGYGADQWSAPLNAHPLCSPQGPQQAHCAKSSKLHPFVFYALVHKQACDKA